MFAQMKQYLDRSSDKWQVEIIRIETRVENWAVKNHDWKFVGEAFHGEHSDQALGEWHQFQGTLDNCIFWLTEKMHASWHNYGHFRLRNTVTNEIIPAELFL